MTETTDLLEPICAGASRKYFKVCLRCKATQKENCGDDTAYNAQYALRPPVPEEEKADVRF